MPKLTFFPSGNADSCLIDLADGQKLLFDFANMRAAADASDRRIDLAAALRDDLNRAGRDAFDVVAFTHADDDHIHGMAEFFWLQHAAKYQGADRIKIDELWVPAAVIVDESLRDDEDKRALQDEARHRLKDGHAVRVFSRPERLRAWLANHGLSLDARRHLITDAGQLVPTFTRLAHGVEFFVHSPFAERLDADQLVDKNDCSLVLQATFEVDGALTRLLLTADTTWENFVPMINITRYHRNDDRLLWDVLKVPHHCSYLSLGPEKGKTTTVPVDQVRWLLEEQGQPRAIAIAPSWPIPAGDSDQPPHRQAASYYRGVVGTANFKVTMEHPSIANPEPLVVTIDRFGPTIKRPSLSTGQAATGRPAPRAGGGRA
jgi:beta-lactamase superfamily II metal-dependent hydrolase